MKKFITFIPRQMEGALNCVRYHAEDNPVLALDRDTRFPIIPVICGYAEKGEIVEVITVCEKDYQRSVHNLEYFEKELDDIREDFGIDIREVPVDIQYSDSVEAQLETFQKLIDLIQDGDDLFCCITYASKVVPIIQVMVMRYASMAKKNTLLRCAVYGQYDYDNHISKIYDITPLFRMDDILQALVKAGVKDVGKAISAIIRL